MHDLNVRNTLAGLFYQAELIVPWPHPCEVRRPCTAPTSMYIPNKYQVHIFFGGFLCGFFTALFVASYYFYRLYR